MAIFDPTTRAWRLTVADREIPPIEATSPPAATPASADSPLSALHDIRAGLKGAPLWAWVFTFACLAMPVVTLGGLIPVLVGFGCAMGCIHFARTTRWPAGVRIGGAAALVAVCWGVFAGLLSLSAHLRARSTEEVALPPAAEGAPCTGRKDVRACSGGDELLCRSGVYTVNQHCRGPLGCQERNGDVYCDATLAVETERCIGGRACSLDRTSELECRRQAPGDVGTWQVRLRCGSSRTCNPKTWSCEWVEKEPRR